MLDRRRRRLVAFPRRAHRQQDRCSVRQRLPGVPVEIAEIGLGAARLRRIPNVKGFKYLNHWRYPHNRYILLRVAARSAHTQQGKITVNTPGPTHFRPAPIAAGESKTLPIPGDCPAAIPGHLMPYEAAAKAIFIRANGAAAYYKATGIVE